MLVLFHKSLSPNLNLKRLNRLNKQILEPDRCLLPRHFKRIVGLLCLKLNMFNFVKQPKRLIFCINYFALAKNRAFLTTLRPFVVSYSLQIKLSAPTHDRSLLANCDQVRLTLSRNKYKKSKATRKRIEDEDESDEEDEWENEEGNLGGKEPNVGTFSVKSMRIDSVLKTVFSISRKKVEESFYENKIRLNGKIVNKKSRNASEDDEIDIIVGFAKSSQDHILVHRVRILEAEANPENDSIVIKVWRKKSLRIDNYANGNPWKEPEKENL